MLFCPFDKSRACIQGYIMSHILIQKSHRMNDLNLHILLEELGKKLKSKYGGEYEVNEKLIHYFYQGVDAQISFDESEIKVEITLGFLMTAFKDIIEKEVHTYLDKHIL